MYRYGMAVDRRDEALYRSVFTPDARIDYSDSGGIADRLDAVTVWLLEALAPFAGLQHNMTNHYAEIEGDTARACTYFVAYHTVAVDPGLETPADGGRLLSGPTRAHARRLAHRRAGRARGVAGRPLPRRRLPSRPGTARRHHPLPALPS